ncbi:50S ribosomal protein L13 [Candidatus Roizmanbacteria bacterium]|nr:50S ribosomal protein L13 [Candidatus Roizmanbacteria bacterium]
MKKIIATKPQSVKTIHREWHLINIANQTLGRTTNTIVKFLQGKQKVNYVSHLDVGDYVVVINAQKVTVSGNKALTKVYTRYSGYPGGLRKVSFKRLLEQKPAEVIRHAISGMLPKNKLRDKRLARLFVFPNEEHPYKDRFKKKLLID